MSDFEAYGFNDVIIYSDTVIAGRTMLSKYIHSLNVLELQSY